MQQKQEIRTRPQRRADGEVRQVFHDPVLRRARLARERTRLWPQRSTR
jgi:hypothetical protein